MAKGLFFMEIISARITNMGQWVCVFLFAATMMPARSFCQKCHTDAKLISSRQDYLESVNTLPAKKLVELKKLMPSLVTDLRYATTNNFTHTVLYRHPVLYLRELPANGLRLVQDDLNKLGLALKIYDAFRPFGVTCTLWRLVADRHYVANPRKGSNHNRGLAVDATIIDLKTGKELDMGTGYDNFTDSAHHAFRGLPEKVLANRRLLKQTMRRHGFGMVPAEWWHYQWHNDLDYEIIDLDFDDLKDIVR